MDLVNAVLMLLHFLTIILCQYLKIFLQHCFIVFENSNRLDFVVGNDLSRIRL